MLPNRFPDDGEEPEYNTVDATLWYFYAIEQYVAVPGDDTLLQELVPVPGRDRRVAPARHALRIGVDPAEGCCAPERGAQLTWMDVRIDEALLAELGA